MKTVLPHHIKTIAAYHTLMQLPKPEHPLASVINFESIKKLPGSQSIRIDHFFLHHCLKKNVNERINLPVNEIAYALGFEQAQSFSKLFKGKTDSSPPEFRQSLTEHLTAAMATGL